MTNKSWRYRASAYAESTTPQPIEDASSKQCHYTPQSHQGRSSRLPDSIAPELLVHTTVASLQEEKEQTFPQHDSPTQPPTTESYHNGKAVLSDTTQRHFCHHANCTKSYARYGDLSRHIKTAHETPSGFLCHFDRCTRSIVGRGFARKDKLVDHLKSKKHKLSAEDAAYAAALHNPPRR